MSLTKLSLGGNYDVIYKLFLPRERLARLGTGISKSFFHSVDLNKVHATMTTFIPGGDCNMV
jgi:hypothetical protein